MQHNEARFTAADGQQRYTQAWLPDESPKAVMVVVHGLGEHSGRYGNLVDYFVPRGFAIHALDHLGHGKSDGTRCFARNMADFVEPLHEFIGQVKAAHPQLPLVLVGHSMGGLISALYLGRHGDTVDVAVLSAPAVFGANRPSGLQKFILGLLGKLAPKAGVQKLDPNAVSRDPQVVQDYINDPLAHSGKLTAGLALTLGAGMAQLPQLAPEIKLPVLIVQGEADKLVKPEGAKALHDWLGSQRKQLLTYPSAYHELFNEPEKQEVFANVEEWLREQLGWAPN